MVIMAATGVMAVQITVQVQAMVQVLTVSHLRLHHKLHLHSRQFQKGGADTAPLFLFILL